MTHLPTAPAVPRASRGQAALAFVIIVFSVALLLAARPAAPPAAATEGATRRALAEAREALLGYAAAYPDRVNPRFGPGYLPCPARDGRGVAALACARATGSTRGRLPWHTLRTNDLRDASGTGLWYAVSESHRYNPKREPLNAATAGELEVDGAAAVAVVMAPGAALAGQVRGGQIDDPKAFLEGRNADGDPSRYGEESPGNDRLAVITARDLRRVAERRVLAELAHGLRTWAARHGGHYPWLAPLATPEVPPVIGQARGWLPVHYFDGVTPQIFESTATPRWDVRGMQASGDTDSALFTPECLQRMPCQLPGGLLARLPGTANCAWGDPTTSLPPRLQLRCDFTAVAASGNTVYLYALAIALDDADGEVPVSAPDASAPRRRAVEAHDFTPRAGAPALRITIAARNDAGEVAVVVLESTAASSGTFAIDDLRYAVDVDAGELPAWLVRNGWHRHVAVAHASCATGADCLQFERVDASGSPRPARGVRALLVAPGSAAGASPAAWFAAANRAAFEGGPQPFRGGPPRRGAADVVHVIAWAP
ncbi:MAG: hypothetical protein AB7Q81_13820 [Gammaproteobacteria bacterium]